jgi:hypothetical protein
MAIQERHVQKGVKEENAYREWEQKWEAIEKRIGGFPTKRHYVLISGNEDSGTMVWEREWASLATMEAAYDKTEADPEAISLFATGASIESGERIELYEVW